MKKLRRKQISSHAAANVYVEREYLPEHNRRFARAAGNPEDHHRRAPRTAELDRIFRLESDRTVSEDWVVWYDNRFFQLEPESHHYAPSQSKVFVCQGRHGNMAIEYRGRALRWQEIPAPRPAVPATKSLTERAIPSCAKRKWVPPKNHSWREATRQAIAKRASKGML